MSHRTMRGLAAIAPFVVAGVAAGWTPASARADGGRGGEVVLDELTLAPGQATTTASGAMTSGGGPAGGGPAGGVTTGSGAHDHLPGGQDDLKGGPGCSIQCITSGVAYARGVGAELVVTTDTAARIWIIVWDDDGYHRVVDSGGGLVQSFSHRFDDLEPGATYQAMAVAADASGYQSEGFGSFTTLERHVEISFGPATLHEAPWDDDFFGLDVWVEGAWLDHVDHTVELDGSTIDLGVAPIAIEDTDRHLDLAVQLSTTDPEPDVCESVQLPSEHPSASHVDCTLWRYAHLEDEVDDLDDRPASASSWTEHTLERTLVLPGGGALPGGYGSELKFTVPVTLHVTYE
jgi:hypothetical protein